jgi:putative transposase
MNPPRKCEVAIVDDGASVAAWKKKYSGLGLNELRELRQLRAENAKLKRLVADLSLDRHILQEIVQKKL